VQRIFEMIDVQSVALEMAALASKICCDSVRGGFSVASGAIQDQLVIVVSKNNKGQRMAAEAEVALTSDVGLNI